MEKKRLFTSVSLLIALLCLLGALHAVEAVGGNPIELSLSNFFPPTHFVNTRQVTHWVKEVEKATGGRVKFTIYPGGTLLKPAETYDGVVSGTADVAIGVFAYTRGRFPLMEAFELPGIYFGSCTATSLVAWEGIKKFQPKELSDTKLMYTYAVGPGSLYSKKEVISLADLKGMRIRATGLTAKSIKALGAVPVAMPMPEAYEALSKGVVEGNIGPPEILKGWKQAEVTKYIVKMPPVYNSIHFCVMNLNKWNSLPANVQKAIEKVNEAFIVPAAQIWDSEMKENGIDYGIIIHDMKISSLSAEDDTKAMALMQPLLDEYVARMNEKGLPGKEILEFVKERAAWYSKLYPPAY
jgi:TRAP-type C4-dicarboxylate transport system substrate-binding protein